jgi:hypothetical protein
MEPDGISDIEGKVARVAASELGSERVSISGGRTTLMFISVDCCKACALAGRIGNARISAESVKKVNEITTRLGNDIIKKH